MVELVVMLVRRRRRGGNAEKVGDWKEPRPETEAMVTPNLVVGVKVLDEGR